MFMGYELGVLNLTTLNIYLEIKNVKPTSVFLNNNNKTYIPTPIHNNMTSEYFDSENGSFLNSSAYPSYRILSEMEPDYTSENHDLHNTPLDPVD